MPWQAEEIRVFILENIQNHPKDIVAVTASHFSVSRTTVHRHLNRLIKENKIVKSGTTKRMVYSLAGARNKEIAVGITPGVEEHKIWESLRGDFATLNKNVYDICEYGFTEIFNNAIEHSQGSAVLAATRWDKDAVIISTTDNGIGIFKKIKEAFNLNNERESILQLSKGKLTTDPEHHTGEGIFFVSRCFDEFHISANGLSYAKLNLEDDWFVESVEDKTKKGTYVSMKIGLKSKRDLKQIFDRFTSPETYKFDRTHIWVQLGKAEGENYISRSQSKRLLAGLEKFKEIILDFKGVTTVGQGFVDEVFRVFKNNHPEIQITYTNANDDVKFMIKRGLPT